MKTIRITNADQKLTDNFNMLEFYRVSHPQHEFDFPEILVQAAQVIRDYFGKSKITCTSSNTFNFGYHRVDKAIDLVTDSSTGLAEFEKSCRDYIAGTGGELIRELRAIGVIGFGIENCCIHLDCRDSQTSRIDKYGKYMIFEFEMKDGKIIKNGAL